MINNSPLGFQSNDPYVRAQIALTFEKMKELENVQIQNDEQSLDLLTDLFLEIGDARRALKDEAAQLKSSNTLLDHQVTEMKLKCTSELDFLLNGHQQHFNLVTKKIEFLIESVNLLVNKHKNPTAFIVSKTEMLLLNTLQQDILGCNILKKQPEKSDVKEENELVITEHSTHFPQSETLSLINQNSILKNKIQKLSDEYKILENEIYSLREQNAKLMLEQKNRIAHHQKELEKTCQCLETPLNTCLELVLKAKESISWNNLITFNASLIRYDILPYVTAQRYKINGDTKAKQRNDELQLQMELIVSSVQGFVDLQKLDKEGTKV